jgi:GntR family transcriptional regulator, transcriptional repressor for pyruvate dehydrogenase complex
MNAQSSSISVATFSGHCFSYLLFFLSPFSLGIAKLPGLRYKEGRVIRPIYERIGMVIQPLKSVRLYEQIAEALRSRIVQGELLLGEKLPTEREIATRYGVSRNVVREAVRALAKDGLVDVRQGSGTYVADGTSRAFGNSMELALAVSDAPRKFFRLIEVRQMLEPSVAALAAERATPEDVVMLRKEVAIMDGAGEDVEAFIAADQRFHMIIAKATGNDLVPLILNPVVDLLDEQRRRLFFIEHSASSAQDFHRKILAAIEKRNGRAAFAAMRAHLEQVSGDISQLAQPHDLSSRRKKHV